MFLDEEGNMEEIFPIGDAKQVMRISTAQLLKEFMRTAVEEGTATAGKPVIGGAGAKTGTAQNRNVPGWGRGPCTVVYGLFPVC